MSTKQGITDAAIEEVMPQPVAAHTLLFSFKLSIGKMAFAGRQMYHNEAIAALPVRDPTVLDREFLFHALNARSHEVNANHAVLGKVLNKRKVKEIKIALPLLDEQRGIAGILNQTDRIERLRTRASECRREFISALFATMFASNSTLLQDWPVAMIEQLLATRRGSIRTGPFGSQLKHSEFIDQGVPVLGIDNVVHNRFLWAKPRFISREKFEKFLRYRVFPADVIITIMGTTGRVCVAPDDLPECMSTKHLCVLTLNRSLVEPLFIWGSLLFDESIRAQTQTHGRGQIMEGWNMTIVRHLRLRVPPLRIQRSFAQIVVRMMILEQLLSVSSNTTSALRASLMSRFFRG